MRGKIIIQRKSTPRNNNIQNLHYEKINHIPSNANNYSTCE